MKGEAIVRIRGLAAAFAVVAVLAPLPAATITVDPDGGTDHTEIQSAIDAAAQGDTVLVKPGEYVVSQPITFRGKGIKVKSQAGAEVTTIRMCEEPADPGRASVLVFENGERETSVLEGFTLVSGRGTSWGPEWWQRGGGGILCMNSSPALTNCTISGNSASWGGGVYCFDSSPALANCAILGNSASSDGGGVHCFDSSPTLTNCTISGNWAQHGGGVGCREDSSPALTNCTISGNSASWGGGVYFLDSSPTLTNCTISGNSACGGGGVCCWWNSSPILVNCIVWGNPGGSLAVEESSQPHVTFCCLETETLFPGEGNINSNPLFCGFAGPTERFVDAASPEGGDGTAEKPFRALAAALQFRLSLKENSPCIGSGKNGANMGADLGTCAGGEPTEPGLVHLAPGRYMVEGLTFSHGVSIVGAGPDRTVLEGTVSGLCTGATLSGVTVTAGTRGGVVIGTGESPTLTNCTISGNSASFYGGGVYCGWKSSPALTDCMISGNSTSLHGGGVYCDENSSPTLTNCTISGNSASKDGGGTYFLRDSSPTLTNCTISGNSASWGGGGVYCDENSSPTLTNCTISGNSASKDGGGVCCLRDSLPILINCTISGNSTSSGSGGGGVYCYRSSPTLTNCTISGNSACELGGGGVYCYESSPILTNCTISGNVALSLCGRVHALSVGGGVYCRGSSPTLTNCTILGNWANTGGGVYSSGGSSPTLTNCTISGNSAYRPGGGVYCTASSPTLTNCIVWANTGGSWLLKGSSQPHVTFCCLETETVFPGEGNINSNPLFCGFAGPTERFVDAASPEGGDGTAEKPFRALAAALQFRLSLKENSPCIGSGKNGANMGADLGTCTAGESTEPGLVHLAPGRYSVEGLTLSHGVSIVGAGPDRTVLEGTVWGLRTGARLSGVTVTAGTRGGVVIGIGESPTLTNCTISGNSGSGVYCGSNSSPTLTNCTISGNSSFTRWGGGVLCDKSSFPSLTNCTISGNSGSGVCCFMKSSPILTKCTISGNSGGGVYCEGHSSPTLTDCTISGNSTSLTGGGLYCFRSSPTMTNCTISGNSASREGGGLYCRGVHGGNDPPPTLINCIISGNSASREGGGLYCFQYSPILRNCTISGNSASREGGGLYCIEDSSPNLTNCIVWGNQPESACGTLSHCLTDRDPMFADAGLFDFGRLVTVDIGGSEHQLPDFVVRAPDYHLQPGSPAIDAGTSVSAPTTDIEGNGRPCGAGVDIGAYESGDCQAPRELFRRGDANASGKFNLADPVALLNYLFGGGEPPGCLDAADVDDSGRLNIDDAIYSLYFLFGGGPEPAMPFPDCGIDPTIDALDCKMPGACP